MHRRTQNAARRAFRVRVVPEHKCKCGDDEHQWFTDSRFHLTYEEMVELTGITSQQHQRKFLYQNGKGIDRYCGKCDARDYSGTEKTREYLRERKKIKWQK